jgi:PAS domain S-box-containing protein
MGETSQATFSKKPLLIGVIVFAALLFLTQAVTYQRYLLFQNAQHRELTNAAEVAKEKLQAALNQSRSATHTLYYVVSKYGINNSFDSVAAELVQQNQFVDAMQLVDSTGTITHVYPLKGNEAALGYNILKDPLRRKEALKAIEQKQLLFAGPFNLKQGGIAVVGRLPMFRNGKFQGFSVALVTLQNMIKAAGIDTSFNSNYLFQLSKVNPYTKQEEFFLPSPEKFRNGNAVKVEVPDGDWIIYVRPKNSEILVSAVPFAILGFILSLLGSIFAWYSSRQPLELQKLVNQKTESLNNEKKLSDTVINALPGIFYMADVNGKLLRWNKNVETFTGYSAEEIAGMYTYNFLDLKDENLSKAIREEAIKKGVSTQVVNLVTKDKRQLAYYFSVLFIQHNGQPVILGIGIDVTEKQKAEQAILREKNLSDSIINSLPGVFYLYDETGKFIRWNKNFETVSEYSATEVANMHPLDFFEGEDKKQLAEKISSVFDKGHDEVEANFVTKTKKKIPYYFTGHKIFLEGKPHLIGMGIDITERKRIEAEVVASEQRLRNTLDNMLEGLQIIGFDWRYIYVNAAAVRQIRLKKEEIIGYTLFEIYPGIDTIDIFKTLKHTMDERVSQETETEFTFPDGTKRWFQLSVQPVPEGIFILSIDITERKRAQQEMIREKVLSESVINSLPGLFYLIKADGTLLRWNKNLEMVSGYTTEELTQMRLRDFIEESDLNRMLQQKQLALEQGSTETELNFVTKDRRKIPYYFTALRINYNQQLGLIGIGIDISERKKAENELLQKTAEIKERVNELQCLYFIADIVNKPDISTSEILSECVNALILAYKYPANTTARIVLDGQTFVSNQFKESNWKQSADILSSGKPIGRIEVFYTELKKGETEQPFSKEEQAMLNSVADIISNSIDRKRAQEAISESEERYRYLFNNNPALILIWDLETLQILEVNNTAIQTYGYTREELRQMTVLQLRPVEEQQKFADFAKQLLESHETMVRRTWWHLKKTGDLMYMDISSHRIDYNNRRAILALAIDITEQHKTEQQLMQTYEDIRRLNAHLQTIREEERASIAREIHDELGQQLTGLKMDTSWLAKKLSHTDEAIQQRITDMLSLIDLTVKTVRRISSELRPGVLDDLGLIAALEWQSSEFQKRTGVTCSFTANYKGAEPENHIATGIFRVYQEALTNVMRHSGATHVKAFLDRTENVITLTVTDNGRGFDQADALGKKTLGLVGMKERALMLGGELQITGKPGVGTTISLKVPLRNPVSA